MNPAEFANIAKSEQQFWWYRGMNRILFGLLDPLARERQFSRVLEAGCGTGYLSKLLAARYGWPMYPVDLGFEGLEYARAMGVERPVQADIARLPFRDGSFDAALSIDVLVHFPRGEEGRAFAEFHRVLRPGSPLVIRVSALDVLRSRHSEFAHEQQRFTRRRLIETVRRTGFRVVRCTYANTLLLPVALAKFRVWEPLLRRPPASGVEPVSPMWNAVLEAPLKVEAAWLARGWDLAAGQSLVLIAER